MKCTDRILVFGLLVVMLVLAGFTSCTRKIPVAPETTEEGMEELIVDPSFNWSTTKDVDIQIYAKDNSGDPLPNVRFDVWDGDPENGGIKIISGSPNDQGVLSISATVPTLLDSVWLISSCPRLSSVKTQIITTPRTMPHSRKRRWSWPI